MPIEKLIDGFRNFRSSYFEESDHYKELTQKGQSPETLVIACSDSRNDPALMTQARPGDLFVVRNVAAIVPPYQPDGHYHGTSAAIEFAVKGLKVKNIIVLGHALCGGVQALNDHIEGAASDFEFLAPWISIGAEARDTVCRAIGDVPYEVKLRALEQAMILSSLANLSTFPWVREAVQARQLYLYGWYFDMIGGRLLSYEASKNRFEDIGEASSFLEDHDGCCGTAAVKCA
ncbi:MAG: carbonic anhydrase [Bdellovibrionales bacterium]